ncbi:MAG TPA: cupredoxin domain-containing protein [Chloroflexota bacterium]|nr:cupredoxin domain-containing protein [Chloroflexota bacterium]
MTIASLAMLLAVSACGGAQVTHTTVGGTQAVAAQPGAGVQAPPAAAAVQQVTISAKELSFTPNSVQLTVGRPVQLTIRNDGQMDHDIKSGIPIRGLQYLKADNDTAEQQQNAQRGVLDIDFNKGDTGQVTFVPTKAGTYQFYCDQPGHREAGMVGSFIVQE